MSKVKEEVKEEVETTVETTVATEVAPAEPVEAVDEVDLMREDTDEEEIDMDDVDVGVLLGTLEETLEKLSLLEQRVESMDKAFFSCLRGLVITIDQLETVVNPLSTPEAQAKDLTSVKETLTSMAGFLKDK